MTMGRFFYVTTLGFVCYNVMLTLHIHRHKSNWLVATQLDELALLAKMHYIYNSMLKAGRHWSEGKVYEVVSAALFH